MDTRPHHRIPWLLAVTLAGGCTFGDGDAVARSARQAFRAVTLLIRAVVPEPPAGATITTGVRG